MWGDEVSLIERKKRTAARTSQGWRPVRLYLTKARGKGWIGLYERKKKGGGKRERINNIRNRKISPRPAQCRGKDADLIGGGVERTIPLQLDQCPSCGGASGYSGEKGEPYESSTGKGKNELEGFVP